MKELIAKGPFRELVVSVMGLLAGHGLISENFLQTLLPLVVAVVAIVHGWASNEGRDQMASLVRKALSLVPGVAVALGVITLEQSELWIALIPSLSAIAWSAFFKTN